MCQQACLLAPKMTATLVAQGCTIQASEEDSRKFYVNDHGKQMKLRAESEYDMQPFPCVQTPVVMPSPCTHHALSHYQASCTFCFSSCTCHADVDSHIVLLFVSLAHAYSTSAQFPLASSGHPPGSNLLLVFGRHVSAWPMLAPDISTTQDLFPLLNFATMLHAPHCLMLCSCSPNLIVP